MSDVIKLATQTINIRDVMEIQQSEAGEVILFMASSHTVDVQVLTGADADMMRAWLAADRQASLDFLASKGFHIDESKSPIPLSDPPPF